jgi:hypothetical protein
MHEEEPKRQPAPESPRESGMGIGQLDVAACGLEELGVIDARGQAV